MYILEYDKECYHGRSLRLQWTYRNQEFDPRANGKQGFNQRIFECGVLTLEVISNIYFFSNIFYR
jgi:hypothetical protein